MTPAVRLKLREGGWGRRSARNEGAIKAQIYTVTLLPWFPFVLSREQKDVCLRQAMGGGAIRVRSLGRLMETASEGSD